MAETPVAIPNRALFKAAEVCEIAQVQPYVLRSWETEFSQLGVAKTAAGPRLYRRSDVEQVLRIKHLLFVEGLTLAGARRRIEEDTAQVAETLPLDELLGRHAKERLDEVKKGLQSILELLSKAGARAEAGAAAPARPAIVRSMARASSRKRTARVARPGKAAKKAAGRR
jgi:DNA-binding transcriptional MerR regulator